MTNPTVDKIRSLLDFSLVSKFDTNDMLTNSYVPICYSRGSVYVLVKASTVQNVVASTVSKILGTSNITIKTISDVDFNELLSFVKSSLHVETVPEIETSSEELQPQ